MAHNFRELIIWKKAMNLVSDVYIVLGRLPVNERFGLRSQVGRSAVSIASNIAEGSGRSKKEFIRFINISLSSSHELETQLMIIERVFGLDVKKTREFDRITKNDWRIQKVSRIKDVSLKILASHDLTIKKTKKI